MQEHRNLTIHYMIRAGILAGFSFYVVHLVKIDKLQLYIAPRMIPYVKYATVALFLLAIYCVHLALQSSRTKHVEVDCDCGGHEPPRSWFKSAVIYGIFVIPLALGFALPDTIMGSDVASMKGMNLQVTTVQRAAKPVSPVDEDVPGPAVDADDPQASVQPDAAADADNAATDPMLDSLFPYDEYTMEYADLAKRLYGLDMIKVTEEGFLEILTAIDLYREHFIGKTVELSGFVYREDDMAPHQFVVSRMAMTCCSADALPYGFLAESSRAAGYEKDAWMTLTGVIGLTEYNGNEIIVLDARKVTMIDAPSDPYVYPFFGDFAQLVQS